MPVIQRGLRPFLFLLLLLFLSALLFIPSAQAAGKFKVVTTFTVIQDISVAVNKTTAFNADPTVAQVEARLKESAAALGGDAVTNVVISDVRIGVMSWGVRTGKGTVVRY